MQKIATEHYQIPVKSIFSTLEAEDESLSEEMPEIVPRATDAHEGGNNEVGLTEEEIILRLYKFPLVSYWHNFYDFSILMQKK